MREVGLGAVRELLRERDFRLLIGSQFLAQFADGFAQAALAEILIFGSGTETDPERILAVFAATLLPYSLIAPFMGVFVDRWPRRSLLSVSNVMRGLVLITFPLWRELVSGDAPLFAGALVLLGLGRLFLTTKAASLPHVLHDRDLLRGNALSGGGGMIAALAGGAIGVGAAAQLGVRWAVALAGLAYLVSAALARSLSEPMAHPHPPEESALAALRRVTSELTDGFAQIWIRPRARLPLIGVFILRTIAMFAAVAAILAIATVYPNETERFGRLAASTLALGAAGVGAFVGAVFTPAIGRRLLKPGLMILGFTVAGLGTLILGGIDNLWAILGLTATGGFGTFVAKVAVDAQIQEAMPDEYRGRAFAAYDIGYNLASVVAALVMVALADSSRRLVLAGAGLAALAISGALARRLQAHDMALTPRGQTAD